MLSTELPPVVLTILLAIANIMGAGMIVPQVLRIRRRRSADGLSAAWVGVGIGLNAAWVVYGTAEQLWGLLPVSLGAGALYVVMAGQLVGLDGRQVLGGLGRGIAVATVIPAVALLAGGWTAAGLTVGLAYAVQFAPATIAALRSTSIAGIAPLTWTMALVEALIWLTYGLATADVALQVGGSGGALMAAVILGRVAVGNRDPQLMAANA
ncbi:MAG: PQ-loop repeat-containing protein [Acidimicrobiales bacterium]